MKKLESISEIVNYLKHRIHSLQANRYTDDWLDSNAAVIVEYKDLLHKLED